jgi:histone deacetylase 1/2
MELFTGGGDNSGSSANMVSRGGRGGGRGRSNGRGRGGFGRSNNGHGNNGNGTNSNNQMRQGGRSNNSNPPRRGGGTGSSSRPQCQVCLKTGHTADRCWHRFEEENVTEERHAANTATNSYTYDTNWYTDTGATDHITGELEKLVVRDKYNGTEQIHTANGAGMQIIHVGHSTIHTLSRSLNLKNILHVPSSTKNLLYVHRLTTDNNVFVEFHPDLFCIKDQETKNILLRGPCWRGLYPLTSTSAVKQAFGVNKPTIDCWHNRLGYPAMPIVERVLKNFNLPYSVESNKHFVCGACQQAKSHQLPYPKSFCVSTQPLELVFSDVWGPTPDSVGRFKYYVSFVDDFSKFTWIYLLKFKSEVFQKFREFQSLVERLFDRKILAIQSDWG